MSGAMRTFGPLHFEDLDPRRFEDLVRQLIYDFRPWRALEATGRGGSDDGFDARGFEIVDSDDAASADNPDDQPEERGNDVEGDRVWLIQCKRERSISPARLRKHLAEISPSSLTGLYAVILVAACDFSKKTRDEFRQWCVDHRISEGYLWGKAELEDQLFQPKNDGLLFAYFGFSLRIRRRSVRTELRAKLAMKRKSDRLLKPFDLILLRDPTDDRYPLLPSKQEEKIKPRRWKVRRYLGQHYQGLQFELYSHFAYIADDRKSWDAVEAVKNEVAGRFQDPWFAENEEDAKQSRAHSAAWEFWHEIPERNRANLIRSLLLPYESILDIDDKTDGIFEGATVFADPATRFLERTVIENLTRFDRIEVWPDPAHRIKFFPDVFPDPVPSPSSA